jgi:excisionase family DNA binding protein
MPAAQIPRLLSLRQLAEQTGVPRPTWYSIVARGEISVVRIGRSVRVTEQDAAAYIAANRERAQRDVA